MTSMLPYISMEFLWVLSFLMAETRDVHQYSHLKESGSFMIITDNKKDVNDGIFNSLTFS